MQKKPAVFLDRDGVINVDKNYVHSIDQLEWIDGVVDAIRLCNESGFFVFVVTNQAGVARGYYDEAAVDSFHRHIASELQTQNVRIDDFRYCPHHVEGIIEAYRKPCASRKPGPGMILDLMKSWPVDKCGSFLIGDKQSDVDAASAAGIPGFLFSGGRLDDFMREILCKMNNDDSEKQIAK